MLLCQSVCFEAAEVGMLVNYMKNIFLVILLCFVVGLSSAKNDLGSCDRGKSVARKFLLYDINPGEGFNLRRDVYMRIAVLVKKLQNVGHWILVLPPWGPLYHWRSKDLGEQSKLPWSLFFSIASLRTFVPVVELSDFLEENVKKVIDNVLYLQHFEDSWTNGKWEEKYEVSKCIEKPRYWINSIGSYDGWFWSYSDVKAHNFSCVSFQGHAKQIIPVLTAQNGMSVLIDRAEILLHDEYGNSDYWKVRRSMRFSKKLYSLANEYRKTQLNSNDAFDLTVLPDDWRDETRGHLAIGGPYICGHLRRQDFLRSRPNEVPSLKKAAKDLRKAARLCNVTNIFIASDGTDSEMDELRNFLEPKYHLALYRPDVQIRQEIKDGGVAIVEQIICSRARYFIGSYESTYSFRIQEEREILNFPPESTFNRFCGDDQVACEQPAKWRLVF